MTLLIIINLYNSAYRFEELFLTGVAARDCDVFVCSDKGLFRLGFMGGSVQLLSIKSGMVVTDVGQDACKATIPLYSDAGLGKNACKATIPLYSDAGLGKNACKATIPLYSDVGFGQDARKPQIPLYSDSGLEKNACKYALHNRTYIFMGSNERR